MLCPKCFEFGSVWLLRKFGKKRNKLGVWVCFSFVLLFVFSGTKRWAIARLFFGREWFCALLGWWEKGKERKEIGVLEY